MRPVLTYFVAGSTSTGTCCTWTPWPSAFRDKLTHLSFSVIARQDADLTVSKGRGHFAVSRFGGAQ